MQSTAPPGLDVGCLLSSYLLAAVLAAGRQPEAGASDTCRRLRSAMREIWEPSAPHASGRQPASHTRRPLSAGGILHTQAYAVRMKEGVVDAPTVSAAGADAAGFAGCELARTALGYAGARGLPIADADAKAAAEAAALRVAERCIRRRGEGVGVVRAEMDALLLPQCPGDARKQAGRKAGAQK